MDQSDYSFRPATAEDMPMLRRWLQGPEVARWWGEPGHEARLLAEDLDNPDIVMTIVSHGRRPFAYAQHYAVHAWPQPQFAHLPAGSRAIDSFIGEPDMLGIGHGSRYLRQLAQSLVDHGAPAVAIDPDVHNHRARRAYARAGFVGDQVVDTLEGEAVLMVFRPQALS